MSAVRSRPTPRERLNKCWVFLFMWYVYILYSGSGRKTYTGYTNDIERRLFEHNVSETKGFTLRYRPWVLIYTECFEGKPEAVAREKFFKTGQGREQLKLIVASFLNKGRVRYPPEAEKD